MTWPCYWLEETNQAEVGLRRFSDTKDIKEFDCEHGYHQAFAWLGERVEREKVMHSAGGARHESWEMARHDEKDPRWPTVCDVCKTYEFKPGDTKQAWHESIMLGADGTEYSTHWKHVPDGVKMAEAGAMWDGWWMNGTGGINPAKPQDGIHLIVRCPNRDGLPGGQDWPVDYRSTGAGSSGAFWTRTGDPREPKTLTVRPSISINKTTDPNHYHGWLTNGVLSDHIG